MPVSFDDSDDLNERSDSEQNPSESQIHEVPEMKKKNVNRKAKEKAVPQIYVDLSDNSSDINLVHNQIQSKNEDEKQSHLLSGSSANQIKEVQ